MERHFDTKRRILDTARELFAEKGVQRTSLREIADRLGITKPALYYHFSSRDELVRSIVQPLIDEGEAFLARHEAAGNASPRALLTEYFDFHYRHRGQIMLIFTELTTLAELGFVELVLNWRARLAILLIGPDPTLERSVRAVIALGGLQDCAIQFPDMPRDDLREAAVDAACAALGLG